MSSGGGGGGGVGVSTTVQADKTVRVGHQCERPLVLGEQGSWRNHAGMVEKTCRRLCMQDVRMSRSRMHRCDDLQREIIQTAAQVKVSSHPDTDRVMSAFKVEFFICFETHARQFGDELKVLTVKTISLTVMSDNMLLN